MDINYDDIFEVKKVGLIKKIDKFNIKNKNIVDILDLIKN